MKDRVVQYPNRFKLTPVSGDIYDITPNPGIVTEEGTDLSKATLLTDSTALKLGLNPDDNPTVNDAFLKLAPVLGLVEDKLLEVTVSTAASSIVLDLSSKNTKQYQTIRFIAVRAAGSVQTEGLLTLNDQTTGYRGGIVGSSYSNQNYMFSITLWNSTSTAGFVICDFIHAVHNDGSIKGIAGVAWTGSSYETRLRVCAIERSTAFVNGITTITITPETTTAKIQPGTKFIVYGVKV